MRNQWLNVALAMSLGAVSLVGCGVSPSGRATLAQTKSFKLASKSVIAQFGHGLGWTNRSGAPIVNDLPGKSLSLGFKVQDDSAKKVDLRPLMSPVYDQGEFGSCTSFAMVKGVAEFNELKAIRDRGGDSTKEFVPLSPAFLWFNERSYMGNSTVDTGADMFLGMNELENMGAPPESEDPYPTPSQQKDPWYRSYFLPATPSVRVYTDAAANKGGTLRQITKLSEIKACLDEGYPAVFGFLVFQSIGQAAKTGLIPVPNLQNDSLLGGHATVAVGYDDDRQVLILKNSWGTEFGDQGYLYMPYKFFDMDLGLVADGWTMRK